MRNIYLDDLAEAMVAECDFNLTVPQAKAFIKKALVQTTDIIKNSKGKIMFRACDLLQVYKSIDFNALKDQIMDVNEVQESRDELRPYKV